MGVVGLLFGTVLAPAHRRFIQRHPRLYVEGSDSRIGRVLLRLIGLYATTRG